MVSVPPTFQSTLPAWGETGARAAGLREGDYFNPLSPHGERRRWGQSALWPTGFQSTLPAWGETVGASITAIIGIFQSTLPAWGETGSA